MKFLYLSVHALILNILAINAQDLEEQRVKTNNYWNAYYEQARLTREPFSFCTFLLDNHYIRPGSSLVDIGCGNGRDTFGFLNAGIDAIGIDASQSAIDSTIEFAKQGGISKPKFFCASALSYGEFISFNSIDNVYARFYIHAIDEKKEEIFFGYLAALKSEAELFLEFRTDKDLLKTKADQGKTNHYRRFINFEDFSKKLMNSNFDIIFALESDNLSVNGGDNPVLGRIIARKR